jgi:hypothetical protein
VVFIAEHVGRPSPGAGTVQISLWRKEHFMNANAAPSIITSVLLDIVNQNAAFLSLDTNVSMKHDHQTFQTNLSASSSGTPALWIITPAGGAPGPDGFTPIMTINYGHSSDDSAVSEGSLQSINGTFNYLLSGDISVNGEVIRMTLSAISHIELGWQLLGVSTENFSANVIDYKSVVEYTVNVDASGRQIVAEGQPANTDNSQDPNISGWGNQVGLVGAGDVFEAMKATLTQSIADYQQQIPSVLNVPSG